MHRFEKLISAGHKEPAKKFAGGLRKGLFWASPMSTVHHTGVGGSKHLVAYEGTQAGCTDSGNLLLDDRW